MTLCLASISLSVDAACLYGLAEAAPYTDTVSKLSACLLFKGVTESLELVLVPGSVLMAFVH